MYGSKRNQMILCQVPKAVPHHAAWKSREQLFEQHEAPSTWSSGDVATSCNHGMGKEPWSAVTHSYPGYAPKGCDNANQNSEVTVGVNCDHIGTWKEKANRITST